MSGITEQGITEQGAETNREYARRERTVAMNLRANALRLADELVQRASLVCSRVTRVTADDDPQGALAYAEASLRLAEAARMSLDVAGSVDFVQEDESDVEDEDTTASKPEGQPA